MAKKLFALEINGAEVRTLEELREQFDLEKIVGYFKDGTLIEWLADRYYEDEAEMLEHLSVEDEKLPQKICAVLGVESEEDLEFLQRIVEKKVFLANMTNDPTIIENAEIVALNQEDLANLINRDYPTVFLCGEVFRVPLRIPNKKYVGILGTPKIRIKANSDEDLADQNIVFENCLLSLDNANYFVKNTHSNDLAEVFESIFGFKKTWGICGDDGNIYVDEPTALQKKMFLKMVCANEYRENDLIHLRVNEDFSAGWALTKDAFCVGGALTLIDDKNQRELNKIFYNEILEVGLEGSAFSKADEYGINFLENPMFGRMVIADKGKNLWIPTRNNFEDEMAMKILGAALGREDFLQKNNFALLNEKVEAQIIKFLSLAKS